SLLLNVCEVRLLNVVIWLCGAGYIGEFEYVDDHRAGKIVVELNGRLNKCGVISPRFDVGVKEIEGWTARLLPSRQVFLHYSLSFNG
ncbi:40S ribosomal protein S15a, partial [Linum perenne]